MTTTANDNHLSDEEIERISERVAELLLQKLGQRLTGTAATPRVIPPRKSKPSADAIIAAQAHLKRLGRTQK